MMTNKSGEEVLSATNLTTYDQLDDQLNSNHTDDGNQMETHQKESVLKCHIHSKH